MGTELTNHKPSNLSRSTLHRQTDARAPRIHEQKNLSFLWRVRGTLNFMDSVEIYHAVYTYIEMVPCPSSPAALLFHPAAARGANGMKKKTREDAAARRHSPSSKTRTHARTPARLPLNTFSCAQNSFRLNYSLEVLTNVPS